MDKIEYQAKGYIQIVIFLKCICCRCIGKGKFSCRVFQVIISRFIAGCEVRR